jgi:hypothetical protein
MDPRSNPETNEPMTSEQCSPPSSSSTAAVQPPALPPPPDPPAHFTLASNKRPSPTGLSITEDLYLHDLATNVAALTTKKVRVGIN